MDGGKTKKRNFGFVFYSAKLPSIKKLLIALGTIKIRSSLSFIKSQHTHTRSRGLVGSALKGVASGHRDKSLTSNPTGSQASLWWTNK